MELVMALWPFEGLQPDDDNNEPRHQNRGTTIKMGMKTIRRMSTCVGSKPNVESMPRRTTGHLWGGDCLQRHQSHWRSIGGPQTAWCSQPLPRGQHSHGG
ncbi:uncharacterized protein BDZ99DRAFT_235257 [Mytilinidion resinicola]|uniref:Uncharacterized protein n=1 Tax=Mytilinidion resinicola TaxID=574789 RepID=A0A6A6Z0U5_9PEZI|nr:uncharacterized protein BDZ99DRAFT_235257 [Mytilinidion resinicola]KAF2814323.1 hypothetical protein BDZ99DRAFT_235257 [Mytilinidion resinicola]